MALLLLASQAGPISAGLSLFLCPQLLFPRLLFCFLQWPSPGIQYQSWFQAISTSSYGCCSVAKLYLTLWDPMGCGIPGFPVLHYLPEFAQIHVHCQWCCLTISSSAAILSFCLQPLPASGSFPMSQLFASGSQSIGASATASVLLMNIQDWFPLGLIGLISLLSKGLSRVIVSSTTIQKHQFFGAQPALRSNFVSQSRNNHMLYSMFCHQDSFLPLLSFRVILNGVPQPQQSTLLADTCTLYRATHFSFSISWVEIVLTMWQEWVHGRGTTYTLPLQVCLGQVLHGPFPLKHCRHKN